MLFQQSGWLDLVEYRANRLHRHRLPLEGHALCHIEGNRLPAELQLALRRQGLPLADGLEVGHQALESPPGWVLARNEPRLVIVGRVAGGHLKNCSKVIICVWFYQRGWDNGGGAPK